MNAIEEKEYTKISISKELHNLVKDICSKEGLKMYFFEDEAIKKYIVNNWPNYTQNGNIKILKSEK